MAESRLTIEDLNKLYSEAEQVDRELFAEMRSNVLLVAGEHYSKRNSSFLDRQIRSTKNLSDDQKLRLTANHTHRIHRHLVTNVLRHAPGATVSPNNEKELQDVKAAELNKSVWDDAIVKLRLKERKREFANDLISLGEVGCKLFWDHDAGKLKGYDSEVDEDGNPLVDEMGNPVEDKTKPIFSGAMVAERIFAFNLLRHPAAASMRDNHSPWIIRKMVDVKILKQKYSGSPDKLKMIEPATKDEFVVFDAHKATYSREKEQALVREFYWPACSEYPEGYFAITTEYGILEEGPLPFGIFPIIWNGCDEAQTSPRKRSPLKVVRPYQSEINRAKSQMAMHQITLGDDKVFYHKGTSLDQNYMPGLRGYSYTGSPPVVLQGRDGGQFLPYVESQIAEMYAAVGLEELNEDQPTGQLDPYTLLHRSMSQSAKHSYYGENFEQFWVDFCTTYLELAKRYLPDDELIAAVGRHEYINISEFRNTSPLHYQIKVEPESDNVETRLGKQLFLSQALQYVGQKLDKEEIAVLLRAMPMLNKEEAFGEMLIDYDNIKNDLLALDRGQYPEPHPEDNHKYVIRKLNKRMKEADFKQLPPEVQQNYNRKRSEHEELMAMELKKIQTAKDGLIPTGGAMIACEMYVPDKKDPSKAPRRVRVPYEALEALVEKLETQGNSLEQLESMEQNLVSNIAGLMQQRQPSQQQLMA